MSNYEEIVAQIYEILGPYNKEGHALNEDTHLVEDLGLDSMQVMQIMLEIEDRYDISVPLNILPEIRSVKDFAAQLQTLIDDQTDDSA